MILIDSGISAFLQPFSRLDNWLVEKINREWTNSVFDVVFIFFRESLFWVPLYLFLLVLGVMNFGRKGLWWCATVIMTAIVSDLFSSSLIKQHIFRYRPCQDPVIGPHIRFIINYCPISSSFISSHACNHFALTAVIFFTMKQTGKAWGLLWLWAFLICYAQVYMGVHFPTDVIIGAMAGTLIGYLMSIFFRKQFGLLRLQK